MGVKRKVMTLINSPLQQEVVVWEGILDGDVQGWTVGAGAWGLVVVGMGWSMR